MPILKKVSKFFLWFITPGPVFKKEPISKTVSIEGSELVITNVTEIKDPYHQPPFYFKTVPEKLHQIITLGKPYYPFEESNEAFHIGLDNDYSHWILKKHLIFPNTQEGKEMLRDLWRKYNKEHPNAQVTFT